MLNEHKYPSQYELEEVLTSITNRSFLNAFAQGKGIFITNISHKQLASEISNYFLDEKDLETIRREAYQININHTLSGFLISSKDKTFSLKKVYDNIFENSRQKEGQRLTQLIKLNTVDNQFKGSIEYNKKRAGRIEFLQDEISSFDFYLKEQQEGIWLVEIDCNRSTDTRELKELFLNNILKSSYEIETIDQDALTTELTITFFDNIAKNSMANEWNFLDVKHLTLRKGKDIDSPLEDDAIIENEESETSEIKELEETEELIDITQAILQGKNLRENSFVKQSVKSGYRFTAMTYEFQHKISPHIIQIKAEFKGRPKVFEVSIINYEQLLGLAQMRQNISLSPSENRSMRSDFWNKSKSIYEELVNGNYKSTK